MRALLLLAVLGTGSARAETQVERACQAEHVRLCSGGSAASSAAKACLRQSYVSLSRPCRSALDAARAPADPYGRGSRLSPRDASASR